MVPERKSSNRHNRLISELFPPYKKILFDNPEKCGKLVIENNTTKGNKMNDKIRVLVIGLDDTTGLFYHLAEGGLVIDIVPSLNYDPTRLEQAPALACDLDGKPMRPLASLYPSKPVSPEEYAIWWASMGALVGRRVGDNVKWLNGNLTRIFTPESILTKSQDSV